MIKSYAPENFELFHIPAISTFEGIDKSLTSTASTAIMIEHSVDANAVMKALKSE
jgi:hypothetical protein